MERHQPRRPTWPRLPVRPGDAAACRPPSTVSHESLDSKHKSSSIAGTAGLLHQAWSSHTRVGCRPPTQTCLRCSTGISSAATPLALLGADFVHVRAVEAPSLAWPTYRTRLPRKGRLGSKGAEVPRGEESGTRVARKASSAALSLR